MPPVGHSRFGASSAYRWITCPASVALCEKVPHKASSSYADEGTAAHELAEMALTKMRLPNAFIGEGIVVNDTVFVVDEEMAKHVTVYVREILKVASRRNNPGLVDSVRVETQFDLDWIGRTGMWGTCDASLADTAHRKLHVFDLKYGAGVPVYAENNWQLMYYALGILGQEGVDKFDTVRLVIVQPRCEESGVTEWEIPVQVLLDWKDMVLIPAYDEAHRPDARHSPSDKGCRWCSGKAICPALGKRLDECAGVALRKKNGTEPAVLPDPATLSDEHIAYILAMTPLLKQFIESIGEYALSKALNGEAIPGYKVVEGRKGNRKWADEAAVENAFSYLGDDIYEKSLLSPAKMEKLLGKGSKDMIDPFTVRADGKLMLAPEDDKRPAVDVSKKSALEDAFGSENL